jgi:hypothetical protein
LHNKERIGQPSLKKLKKKLRKSKHNGWNREWDVKERYEDFIETTKEKLEEISSVSIHLQDCILSHFIQSQSEQSPQ